VRLFVVGAVCAGKTTLARHLQALSIFSVVDMDDEIVRLNGGAWPDIETKNDVVLPKVLERVRAMPEVVLLGSLPLERTRDLRQAGFSTVLLDVSETELRRRHAVRLAEEGWTNIEWFDYNQSVIRALRDHDLFDHVISGEQPVEVVAAQILSLIADLRTAAEVLARRWLEERRR
jgi:predicted kinase